MATNFAYRKRQLELEKKRKKEEKLKRKQERATGTGPEENDEESFADGASERADGGDVEATGAGNAGDGEAAEPERDTGAGRA